MRENFYEKGIFHVLALPVHHLLSFLLVCVRYQHVCDQRQQAPR